MNGFTGISTQDLKSAWQSSLDGRSPTIRSRFLGFSHGVTELIQYERSAAGIANDSFPGSRYDVSWMILHMPERRPKRDSATVLFHCVYYTRRVGHPGRRLGVRP